MKDIKTFLKKKKKNNNSMLANVTKISQKMKKKLVEYTKQYYKMRKSTSF